jgi:hypothetical protein
MELDFQVLEWVHQDPISHRMGPGKGESLSLHLEICRGTTHAARRASDRESLWRRYLLLSLH